MNPNGASASGTASDFDPSRLPLLQFARLCSQSYPPLVITLGHSPVHSDPELMGGTLVFRGTRVPAQTLLDYLQDGYDLDGFLEEFPSVRRVDAEEFLRLACPETRL